MAKKSIVKIYHNVPRQICYNERVLQRYKVNQNIADFYVRQNLSLISTDLHSFEPKNPSQSCAFSAIP